jgi:hypothetical protein
MGTQHVKKRSVMQMAKMRVAIVAPNACKSAKMSCKSDANGENACGYYCCRIMFFGQKVMEDAKSGYM